MSGISRHKEQDCLGCRLANGELPVHMVYENEWVACFLDHDPFGEGHVLILPKAHYRFIDDMDSETALAILNASQLMSRAIRELYAPFGITQTQNGGGADELTHFHLHVVPRDKNQPFASFYTGEDLDNEALKHHLADTRTNLVAAVEAQLSGFPGK
ncbi:HIT family protein [Planococcus sp. CP5-4]|uniref:HIT family protein n=1 Tax=unclassified Planococcus (in: firmicutes) TaxID=2662419 RepID=UPI001C246523|nr:MULTISPECIES: HIT family protein [unclassified Planococcus (in: firmicutes)]MBU9672637.1 HIT family protein [Planococcus sp. CP5-4_YE]MBV0909687.1 HIT family protein [Planococcus sp. CP5-4_UN]MBW6064417.1 HIT family protein [Planococcus sp. CP5-4]